METLISITEYIMMYTVFVYTAKYIFMEPTIKGFKRYIYHGSAVLGVIVFGLFVSFLLPVWSFLTAFGFILIARETKRVLRGFACVPMIGVVNGILLPFASVPDLVFGEEDQLHNLVKFVLYTLITLLLLLIQFRMEDDGMDLGSSMMLSRKSRKLSKFERFALWVVGCFEFIFEILIILADSGVFREFDMEVVLKMVIWIFGVSSFMTTGVLISVILSGNKRTIYSDKISDMQFNIIVTMAEIVENRDESTGGHIQRTARYVDIIARQLKRNSRYSYMLTDSYIDDLRVAAPLHDIGKIHVPDSILKSPDSLSDEEYKIMQAHTTEGKKLLQNSKSHLGNFSYLDAAIEMAGYHHEWWDGTGYPEGLMGENIPLGARIMAVADVFDALTSERVYKHAMSLDEATSIIKSESGTHFDPEVVDAFVKAEPYFRSALDEFLKGK